MSEYAPLRFYYRYVPWDRILYWGSLIVIAVGLGLYVGIETRAWGISWVCFGVGVVGAVRVLWLRTFLLLVNADGLTVVKKTLAGRGNFDFFASGEIRVMRYRSEVHHAGDDERRETRYILDLITTEGKIATLIESSGFSLRRDLGAKAAKALGCRYEEYLG